jgi:hypothetical protein
MLANYIRKKRNPARYHGNKKKSPFFEGWYYKMVSRDESSSFTIIPGIFLHTHLSKSTAFIQVVNGVTSESFYIDYPIDTFKSKDHNFELNLAGNHFTTNSISLNIKRNELSLDAELFFPRLNPWPITSLSPGIMGWYSWVPFMECFHGVLSLDHSIKGQVTLNGELYDFSGGKGYIEKDWGQAFPEAWVWQQSNHFPEDGISLTASIAIIPWIGNAFPGFIIGFLMDGKLFRLATYTGAKTRKLELKENEIHWVVEDKHYILEMHTLKGSSVSLRAPTPEGMTRQIAESIDSKIEVRFFRKIKTGKTLVYQGAGNNSGLEVEGNIDRLLEMLK